MKTVSPQLQALFASRQFYAVKLFTFTLFDGTVLRYCSGDRDVTWAGHTYSCGNATNGPYFERTDNKAKAHWAIGTSVDTLSFDVIPGTGAIEGIPFARAVLWGLFDGAELDYTRAYAPTGIAAITGVLPMFTGGVADVSFGRSVFTFTINSDLQILVQNMPRNLFQAGCINTLFDVSCTLNPAGFSDNSVVVAGSTASMIVTALPKATGYYDLGKVTMTSGALAGLSRPVRKWTAGTPGALLLGVPFPAAPVAGAALTAFAGCDKQQVTCAAKFNNFANFRATPYVPAPETAT